MVTWDISSLVGKVGCDQSRPLKAAALVTRSAVYELLHSFGLVCCAKRSTSNGWVLGIDESLSTAGSRMRPYHRLCIWP